MTGPLYKAVMEEIPTLISDNDLHISQLVLTLLCTVMNVSPASIIEVLRNVVEYSRIWLSRVEIEYYSAAVLIALLRSKRCISELPLRGGAETHCVNTAAVDATTHHV